MRIERVLANNPGPFTGAGTNTWILDEGSGVVVIIDPGPVDSRHATKVFERVGEREVAGVLVTHTHLDHAPLANPMARDLDVPAIGHAPGPQFEPEIRLLDGATFEFGEGRVSVVHTPGHADDHLCFRIGNVLFTGDHIIGGSSVMVEDLGSYMASLEKVRGTGVERMLPGHGDEIDQPDQVIDWYIAHRRQRHEEILRSICSGADSIESVVEDVYRDVDSDLHPLAAHSVAAHVQLLTSEGAIAWQGERLVPTAKDDAESPPIP